METVRRFSAPILDTCDRIDCENEQPTVYVDGAAWCEECASVEIEGFAALPVEQIGK